MIAEAYTALEAILKEEERSRPQVDAEETDMPYEMAEDRHDGATKEGAEQNTLSACGNRTTKDKAELPIGDSESGHWRSKPRLDLRDWEEDGHRPRGAGGYGQERK